MQLKLNNDLVKSFPNQKASLYDTVESGLILRVSEKGTKSFCFRYEYGGNRKRFTFGRYPKLSVDQARLKVQSYKEQLLNGIDPQSKKKKRKQTVTFRKLATEFKNKHVSGLRETSQKKYTRIIDNELLPSLEDKLLTQITKSDLLEILDNKAHEQGHPTTANFIRKRLFTMFKFAMQRDMIEYNIVDSIPPYKNGNNSRSRYYSDSEIQEIWKAFDDLPEPNSSYLKILLLTAQRKTETRKMKYSCIDFENAVWTIPASDAKNKNEHKVPLTETPLRLIKHLKKNYSGDSTYVFQTRYDNISDNMPIQKLCKSVKKVKEASGIKDFRLHDLRRTATTYFAKLGVRRTVAGKLLNHKGLSGDSSVTAIYDRYSYQEEKREALERWDQHLQDQVGV